MFKWFNSLKIGRKILIGYGTAIAVAVIGIATGYKIANFYEGRANLLIEDAIGELLLINRLQNNLFLTRNTQLEIIIKEEKSSVSQIEFNALSTYISQVQQIWSEFDEEHGDIDPEEIGESLEEKKITDTLVTKYQNLEPWLMKLKQIILYHENKKTVSPEITTENLAPQLREIKETHSLALNQFITTLNTLHDSVVLEYEEAQESLQRAEILKLEIIITSLVLSCLIATILGSSIIRTIVNPLEQMTTVIQDVRQTGKFDRQIPITTSDELGFLGKSFNQLIGQVQQLLDKQTKINDKLARYNQTLEEQVEQRTEKLSQTVQQLQTAQAEIIQSEKMAALGHLVAGIAHEVNTPLGAIKASISNINSNLEQSFKVLPQLLQQLSPQDVKQFCLLLDWATKPKGTISTREERQLRRKLEKKLTEQSLEFSYQLADTLSKMHINESLEPILPLLKNPAATFIINSAYQLAGIQNNSRNISLATERAAKIVFALKTYIHQDNSDSKTKCDIRDSIDLVLTLYHNQIKRGIEVIKNYETIPEINCYAEELTQVWSNLIGNAIQGMNYQGTLNINTKEQDNYVVVEIEDTGSGIPKDIQEKIFEPFFTTKAPGEGSGLGLHIVQQIIEKHQGLIKFSSEIGYTKFSVWLPII